jgi:hypothetical protein
MAGPQLVLICFKLIIIAVIYKSKAGANRAGTGACPYSLTWALRITGLII